MCIRDSLCFQTLGEQITRYLHDVLDNTDDTLGEPQKKYVPVSFKTKTCSESLDQSVIADDEIACHDRISPFRVKAVLTASGSSGKELPNQRIVETPFLSTRCVLYA